VGLRTFFVFLAIVLGNSGNSGNLENLGNSVNLGKRHFSTSKSLYVGSNDGLDNGSDNGSNNGLDNGPNNDYASDSSSSSVNEVFNSLKDASTPEFDAYFEEKQKKFDDTKNEHISENRETEDSDREYDSADEGLGSEFNYRDDTIMDIHSARTKNLEDRKEIVHEMREEYKSNNKYSNDSSELPSTSNKRSRDEDNDDDNSNKRIKGTNDSSELPSTSNKRSRDEDSEDNNSNKRIKGTNDSGNDNSSVSAPKNTDKESCIDFILEKESLELPSIPDSDGGGD
jgi:hypothetical protein